MPRGFSAAAKCWFCFRPGYELKGLATGCTRLWLLKNSCLHNLGWPLPKRVGLRRDFLNPAQYRRIFGTEGIPSPTSLFLLASRTPQSPSIENACICLRASELPLPATAVNDDFCDCEDGRAWVSFGAGLGFCAKDGSDEPGTAACAGRPGADERLLKALETCERHPAIPAGQVVLLPEFRRHPEICVQLSTLVRQGSVRSGVVWRCGLRCSCGKCESSGVGDGICDCCDGSDEWQLPGTCPRARILASVTL